MAQTGHLEGVISGEEGPLEFATVRVVGEAQGVITGPAGRYRIEDLPVGRQEVQVDLLGFESKVFTVDIQPGTTTEFNVELVEDQLLLDEIVVTGTRTFKRQTSSPVIVNVISSQTLEGVQACNLSEGLRFQPGLRVETDCQTCNYTQLRMNGLAGGYSQILINGRPIFSPLTGLYGLEQIPTNMIEQIEVVRGGGSVLYGTGAIGGTVNVITRIPKTNGFDLSYNQQLINGVTPDRILNGNATLVNEQGNSGMTVFINNRRRAAYDHNGDNFSELSELQNNSFGTNFFFLPDENQKLEVSLSNLNEYRYGGEMVSEPAHLTQQAEERTHTVWMGSADYQLNFNDDNSSWIAYLAGQRTDREHYTGIFPDEEARIEEHLVDPPYGTSKNTTFQLGTQINHRWNDFLGGANVLTLGAEFIQDDILDVIPAYGYEIDQITRNLGVFAQSDWEILPALHLLSGLRVDRHNLVDRLLYSPRFSVLYKFRESLQWRLTYGTGFRAPQAFDADLHIAFAGGGVSRVTLDPDLREERSRSWSTSLNYDHVEETWIAGFTLEGFYTKLDDAFFLDPIGTDAFGERFVKRNGPGSTVQGGTLELRANYNRKVQLEAGFTVQTSLFDEPVENIDGLEPRREFLRTPNDYGYATLTLFPEGAWNTVVNVVYTGRMELAHFGGAPEQLIDAYKTSERFVEWSFRTGYTLEIPRVKTGLELFGGVKNLTNAYQSDFDTGKNRDSNYVYGPGLPRTFFLGVRLHSLE